MTLILDSNAFPTAAMTYYAFDICGSYWSWIAQAASTGDVNSISPVKRELRQKDDQIRHWIDMHGSDNPPDQRLDRLELAEIKRMLPCFFIMPMVEQLTRDNSASWPAILPPLVHARPSLQTH